MYATGMYWQLSTVSSEILAFNFGYQSAGQSICTWARREDPWLFFEAKTGRRAKTVGKRCSRPPRRTRRYIWRTSEQHERPLYAASGGCTPSPNTRTYLPHSVTLRKAAFIYDKCSLPDRTRPGVLVTGILQHAGYCSTNIAWKMCPLKPSGHYMYHQFNNHNFTFCPYSVFVCFVWIAEQTNYFLIQHNWLVFTRPTHTTRV